MRRLVLTLACFFVSGAAAFAGEVAAFNQFLAGVGLPVPSCTAPAVSLESASQDFGSLTTNASCYTHTPLRIGQKGYAKGLGSHANGRIVFRLNKAFRTFAAEAGIDNNDDTRKGAAVASAAFMVKGDGRLLAQTPVCRFGQPARHIEVSLENVRQLELIISDAGDGISYDQADWADAKLIGADGQELQLSDVVRETSPFLGQARLPASFRYAGQSSEALLRTWARTEKPPVEKDGRRIHEITWEGPGSLAATWHAEVFLDRPAVEFRWIFQNRGQQPSKPLSDVCALDLSAASSQARLMHSTGGLTGPADGGPVGFMVSRSDLPRPGSDPAKGITLSAAGGRSSNRDLPFFVLHDEASAGGIFVGVGWSGQWQADFRPDAKSGKLRIAIGMPDMNIALPAGERIISPSILLGAYSGDPQAGGNALRRILYDHYVARLAGRKPLPPVSWNHWFTFENNISEAMLACQIDAAAGLGLEYFCIDAGWFDGGFSAGVGNWTLDRRKFPHGSGPIGKRVADNGMKLGLWFETGQAFPGTRLAKEHPEWLSGPQVKLEMPAARQWLFEMMCHFIDEGHVRWIRYDYNQDPLGEWNRRDTPDTRGLTQIRYLQGEYEFLDRLRQKYPDLCIESCASGGRRIDLETIRRAHTFWKSDETNDLLVARLHETGGNQLLPGGLLNTNLPGWCQASCFELHSLFGGPLGFALDWTRLDAAARERVRQAIAAFKSLRRLLNRDYYPLFPQSLDPSQWVGWEFHDPAGGEGFFVVLRPAQSSYQAADLRLRGLDERKTYRLGRVDDGRTSTATGRQLLDGLPISLGPGGSQVWRFQQKELSEP
jgi:alpha-galactosidase